MPLAASSRRFTRQSWCWTSVWYQSGRRPLWLPAFRIIGEISAEDHSGAEDGVGYNQKHWCYYPDFRTYSGHKFLSGWWQSERFFEGAAKQVRADLELRDRSVWTNARAALARLAMASKGPIVEVHCRRTDYIRLADSGIFRLLGTDYNRAAMSRFEGECIFVIFSDEIDWYRSNLQGPRVTYCDYAGTLQAFTMMCLCDHFVIANSTFSWWAAWLGETRDSVVVAPRASEWFGTVLATEYESEDIVPSRWETIPLAP